MNRFLQAKTLPAVYYEGSLQTGCLKSYTLYIPALSLRPPPSLTLPWSLFKNTSISQVRHFPKPSHHYNYNLRPHNIITVVVAAMFPSVLFLNNTDFRISLTAQKPCKCQVK